MNRALKLLMIGLAGLLMAVARPAIAAPEATGEKVEHVAAEGHGESSGELVPVTQEGIQQALYQAIWVLVIFGILLVILYPTAWKGVLAGLKGREEHIRKQIADAEAARAKAEALLQQYAQQLATAEDKVRELIAKAQADGERVATTIRDNAAKEAEGVKAKALTDIADAGKVAVARIHDEAAEMATAIAEKIIRKNLNVDDQRELVRASLQQLDNAGRN